MAKAKTVKVESNKFWDSEVLVTEIPVSDKSAIKVTLAEKDGNKYADIRKFVIPKGATKGFTQHTTKGLSLELTTKEDLVKLIESLAVIGEAVFDKPNKSKKSKKKSA